MTLFAAAVLVELFTSEGCSSCPPADAALARLHQKQPVPGVQLILLSEHVDYWDNLGWKDPFSDPKFSDRQSRYGSRVYTPQAVIDGRVDVLGSDEEGIARAAKAAATTPHGTLVVTPTLHSVHNVRSGQTAQSGQSARTPETRQTGQSVQTVQTVQIAIRGLPPHGPAQVFLAVVEDSLVSKVERGENQGRTLGHTAVVRRLEDVGSIAARAVEWSGEAPVPRDPVWKKTRLVVFVQDRESLRVLAAGSL